MQITMSKDEALAITDRLTQQAITAIVNGVVAALRPMFSTLQQEVKAVSDAQSDINAQAAAINTAVSNLQAAVTAIQAEIAALQQNNPTVDTSALDAAVASLTDEVNQVAAVAPAPSPAPGP